MRPEGLPSREMGGVYDKVVVAGEEAGYGGWGPVGGVVWGVWVDCDRVISLGEVRARVSASLEVGEFNGWLLGGSHREDEVGGTEVVEYDEARRDNRTINKIILNMPRCAVQRLEGWRVVTCTGHKHGE
jgi:hypothetical protein